MNKILVFTIQCDLISSSMYTDNKMLFASQQLFAKTPSFSWYGEANIVLAIDQEIYPPGIEHMNWLFGDTGLYVNRSDIREMIATQVIPEVLKSKFLRYGKFEVITRELKTFKIKKK